MKLTNAANGTSTFVVDLKAVPSDGYHVIKPNRDCGKQFKAEQPLNVYRLGALQMGCNISVVNVTSGIKARIEIIPRENEAICYRGHAVKGCSLVSNSKTSTRGDFIKLASLDGSMWHVIESSGEWIKEWPDGDADILGTD